MTTDRAPSPTHGHPHKAFEPTCPECARDLWDNHRTVLSALAGLEKERDEAQDEARGLHELREEVAAQRDLLNARGLSCCPDLDLMHWRTKAQKAEARANAAEAETLRRESALRAIRDACCGFDISVGSVPEQTVRAVRWLAALLNDTLARADRAESARRHDVEKLTDIARAAESREAVLRSLLGEVTLDAMGGTPDLFGPRRGWEELDAEASRALSASGDTKERT